MNYEKKKYNRQSLRLDGFDYSSPRIYFITVCVQNREQLFGEVINGEMRLNNAGFIIQEQWNAIQIHYEYIRLDAHVIMPDHFHGIIELDAEITKGAASSAPTRLGEIIRRFKSKSAIFVNKSLSRNSQPLWQRNYWERIIRNQNELGMVRNYIYQNPINWHIDKS